MQKEEKPISKTALENYLLKHIPISSAMGVEVDMATSAKIILKAPFSNNINHKKTVFGGSLHALATLACWSLLHVNLMDAYGENVQIVIANSEVDYLVPVASDFKAECMIPVTLEWERFIKMLEKKGKGRIRLNAKIFQGNQLCVDYTGTFVALRTNH
ncbi:MAG TPA: YiiD C-terminal domain-containing protein [Parachlamydiaceae bacterium]|nr:YiiD C-terminal domain-containing protein [Parachlamydiaceae bacterium]